MSCRPIQAPGLVPGWGCCACEKAEGRATYNGEQRAACKHCGHVRCDQKVSGNGEGARGGRRARS